ncbi:PREDICTED: uncharacterized protein LOC109160848 [Ipomoea nil]|uniref:uncharacterized protein LOC109160848 n=1 Tax=Ipomoea nil TaxID=35883 RepID=UPI000900F28A|nr:PREDICTED: uncharacterized protein LOC109160848 [Ipomoea nil]
MTALANRRVNVDIICPLCRFEPETIMHLFANCSRVQPLWNDVNCQVPNEHDDFAAWFSMWLTLGENGLVMKCIAICWSIWKGRNDLVWNSKTWDPASIMFEVANMVLDWQGDADLEANNNVHVSSLNSLPVVDPGIMSIYVDATVYNADAEAYYGVFVMDSSREFVAAKNGLIRCLNNAHLAEALAVKKALSWVKELGFAKILIFSDCKNVCRLLNGSSQDLSYAGCVIRECRALKRHFELVSIQYVSRSVNRFAHALARATRS